MAEFLRYENQAFVTVARPLVREAAVTLVLNEQNLGTMMVTPERLEDFAVGFLWLVGLIMDQAQVESVVVDDTTVRIVAVESHGPQEFQVRTTGLHRADPLRTASDAERANDQPRELHEDLTLTPERILELVRTLNANAEAYRETGGVHTTLLACPEGTEVMADDVGRHNTVDKIVGECLRRQLTLAGGVLVTSGRITLEFVRKAARMQVPVLISRTSPTDAAVAFARHQAITLIGYARGGAFNIYTGSTRVRAAPPACSTKLAP